MAATKAQEEDDDPDDFHQLAGERPQGVHRVLPCARRRAEPAVFRRTGLLDHVFGRNRRDAADPRALPPVHPAPDRRCAARKPDAARAQRREPRRGQRHAGERRRRRRARRPQPGAGPRIYVQPKRRGPGRQRVGNHVDGPEGPRRKAGGRLSGGSRSYWIRPISLGVPGARRKRPGRRGPGQDGGRQLAGAGNGAASR